MKLTLLHTCIHVRNLMHYYIHTYIWENCIRRGLLHLTKACSNSFYFCDQKLHKLQIAKQIKVLIVLVCTVDVQPTCSITRIRDTCTLCSRVQCTNACPLTLQYIVPYTILTLMLYGLPVVSMHFHSHVHAVYYCLVFCADTHRLSV